VTGIAVIAISFIAIVFMASNMHRNSHPMDRIREECQRIRGDVGIHKVTECIANLALRYARQPDLP
jgi:uncharacterized protein YoxC